MLVAGGQGCVREGGKEQLWDWQGWQGAGDGECGGVWEERGRKGGERDEAGGNEEIV